jgi:Xaa-Pro aminopeptidase
MRKLLTVISLFLFLQDADSQENLPTDFLSPAFHKGRRDAFRKLMPANSVALIFAYPERVFSRDVNYVYHQNPDLHYLSGYDEPNSVLILFKEMQGTGDSAYNEVFFVRERHPTQEIWTGRRHGVDGTRQKLGFTKVYTGDRFNNFAIEFSRFSTILYDKIPVDVPDDGSGYDLAGLIRSFKEKAKIKPRNETLVTLKNAIRDYATPNSLPRIIDYYKMEDLAKSDPVIGNDPIVKQVLNKPDTAQLAAIIKTLVTSKDGIDQYDDLLNTLRETKTPEELALIRKAAWISAQGHAEVMRAVAPSMGEREAEGIHRYIHAKHGAEQEGYPPIVGAGANGCILHYEENNATKINNQLLLMDVACEYHGYSADVTRTIPANGKFSPEQKAIYEIVYEAQDSAILAIHDGVEFPALSRIASRVLTRGLQRLGIIKDKSELVQYYPHGLGHHIGLDVHDRSPYGTLKKDMVITIEPGIYIPAGSKCDPKWWNIGVRIEDDILITATGYENLSNAAPRKWQEIEKMIAAKSMFEQAAKPVAK